MKKYLPVRKCYQGKEPGMGSQGLKPTKNSEKKQWFFPRKDPSDEILKEIGRRKRPFLIDPADSKRKSKMQRNGCSSTYVTASGSITCATAIGSATSGQTW